jgi:hypothetical protein
VGFEPGETVILIAGLTVTGGSPARACVADPVETAAKAKEKIPQ